MVNISNLPLKEIIAKASNVENDDESGESSSYAILKDLSRGWVGRGGERERVNFLLLLAPRPKGRLPADFHNGGFLTIPGR